MQLPILLVRRGSCLLFDIPGTTVIVCMSVLPDSAQSISNFRATDVLLIVRSSDAVVKIRRAAKVTRLQIACKAYMPGTDNATGLTCQPQKITTDNQLPSCGTQLADFQVEG